jgi:hypothetical protein
LGKALGGRPIAALERLDREDAYYCYDSYDGKAALPVYRARLAGAQHTTFYIDAGDGRMVRAVDDTARQGRWLRTGLHDFDFGALRARPLWDVVVLLLLAGGCRDLHHRRLARHQERDPRCAKPAEDRRLQETQTRAGPGVLRPAGFHRPGFCITSA